MLFEDAGTYKRERVILGKQSVEISVERDEKKMLNFCANNYLGLSSHPHVIEAVKDAVETHGAGMSSVRFICGTQDIHRQLELKIAQFHGRQDSILYAACFDANSALFDVLTNKNDAIISDELNHASIIDGVRLSKAKNYRYKHLDMTDLEKVLIGTKSMRRRIIATDGVFSMDGDVAPLGDICDLAEKYNAITFVDECHATGFFGATGRGTEEQLGVQGRVDIINSTLGKALGGAMGGYTTGSRRLIDLLRQRSRPYLFSNSLAPPIVGASLKVLDMLMTSNELASSLKSKIIRFRDPLIAAGFKVLGNRDHPICPILLGDARLASKFADEMLHERIYVIGFSYPVVPKGKARIRVQISAAHSNQDIDRCVDAFVRIGKRLAVI
uniref:Aminotransferase class I/classII domain-containing protein n=1 Tax=Parascaris univalens TaxID=6257 RepID=A0A915A0R8_PARUN